jgi:hypothetical protein
MSSTDDWSEGDVLTLDPPGAIAVVGAGPMGIEAALYGRFLGYDVTLLEAVAVGHSMLAEPQAALPRLPGRCLSPLAAAALQAQLGSPVAAGLPVGGLPQTCGQWVDEALRPLAESDLLHGRLRLPALVTEIIHVAVSADPDASEGEAPIPADFRLTFVGEGGRIDTLDVEAVILAVGQTCDIRLGFQPPVPYFFRINALPTAEVQQQWIAGHREIVAIYAGLAGRAALDLYRPRRV